MINQTSRKYSLKRKLKKKLPLESKLHRGGGKLEHDYFAAARTCQLENLQQQGSAFRILTSQLKDQKAKKIHLNNIKISLNRRIRVAKLQQNDNLMITLNKELKEITCR